MTTLYNRFVLNHDSRPKYSNADDDLMAKDQTLVLAAPFRFGFFAGLGFFVASVVMSVLTFMLVALLGLGTIGAMITGMHAAQTSDQKNATVDARPARWQVSDSR